LASAADHANGDETRWRVYDREGESLLAISDTDEATDSFGLPLFTCKDKSGSVGVEGEAKENLRVAMIDRIRSDAPPWIQVMPETMPETTTLDLFFR
jgi:hypothetical protein